MCHWMGGSQRPNITQSWCLQNVMNHSHSPNNMVSTSQNIWTLSITTVRSPNLTSKPHGWDNIVNTVQAECRYLCNSSHRVWESCCLLPAVKVVQHYKMDITLSILGNSSYFLPYINFQNHMRLAFQHGVIWYLNTQICHFQAWVLVIFSNKTTLEIHPSCITATSFSYTNLLTMSFVKVSFWQPKGSEEGVIPVHEVWPTSAEMSLSSCRWFECYSAARTVKADFWAAWFLTLQV